MAKISSSDLLDAFKDMTLLEPSDSVKQSRRRSTSPLAPWPSRPPRLPVAVAVATRRLPNRTSSTSSSRLPRQKIQVIKEVRTPDLALARRRPRTWWSNAPKPVLEKVAKDAAKKAKAALEGAGATVTLLK